jgi:maltose alpha-D-glucosyltransferase/alpha-amylase
VLAYVREYKGEVILCVANLSRSAQATELDLSKWKERVPLEMLGRTRFPAIGELPYMITLAPYGFYWFELQERDKSEPVIPRAVPEFETLVVPLNSTWVSLARTRGVFERDVLPGHLARTRWYPEHSPEKIHPTLVTAIPFCDIGDNRPWLAFFETTDLNKTERYLLPMQIEWVRFDRERYNPRAFAAVRQGAREGTLLDVATDPIFIGLLLRNLRESLTVTETNLQLEFRPTDRFDQKEVRQPESIRSVETGKSNSTALVDGDYCVKVFRKTEAGINPVIELGRFLTEIARFPNAPALLGTVEFLEGQQRSAIATVHTQIANQGDGWTVTSAYLDRFVDDQRLLAVNSGTSKSEEQIPYLRIMSHAGRRLAELHLALAGHAEIPEFAPEEIIAEDVKRWTGEATSRVNRLFDALGQRDAVRETARPLVDKLLAQRDQLTAKLNSLLPPDIDAMAIRVHGDFRLEQMLIVKNDIFIIGFEGDPGLRLAERRRKSPPARDVAALIRSIDYSVRAAFDRALKLVPDEQGRLTAALAEWRDSATAAFLVAYRDSMTNTRLWPADPHTASAVLDFFLLEKAVHEIEYELAHRPDWLHIPVTDLLRLLER